MADWQAGLLVLAAAPLMWALMYVGWRNRRRRQRGIAAPPPMPPTGFEPDLLAAVEGLYVSTVRAGDWLDRIAVHGLGLRGPATLSAGRQGVWIRRAGAPGMYVPAADLVSVHRDSGQAGKFVAEEGLIVLTWQLGEQLVDTAFRPREWPDIATVEAALRQLTTAAPPRGADDAIGAA